MSGPLTVQDGALIIKDPADISVLTFDWDATHLAASVTISTSTFTITALRPSTDTALTKDNAAILSGNRKTQIRITGGTLGAKYRLDNRIVTNESPVQEKERSDLLLVQNK
jgi:hypothetical protein